MLDLTNIDKEFDEKFPQNPFTPTALASDEFELKKQELKKLLHQVADAAKEEGIKEAMLRQRNFDQTLIDKAYEKGKEEQYKIDMDFLLKHSKNRDKLVEQRVVREVLEMIPDEYLPIEMYRYPNGKEVIKLYDLKQQLKTRFNVKD